MTGPPPPPCTYCSFTSVGLYRAVLFGGYQPDVKQITDAVYFVDIRDKVLNCDSNISDNNKTESYLGTLLLAFHDN